MREDSSPGRDSHGKQMLTKTNYAAGLQCLKRLFFEKHRRELRDPLSEEDQARMAEGTEVGELARGLYPGGRLIKNPPWKQDEAEAATRKRIEGGAKAIYEAALSAGELGVRVDILSRSSAPPRDGFMRFAGEPRRADVPDRGQLGLFGGGDSDSWEIIEVKSGMSPRGDSGPKDEYLEDVAFQTLVAVRSGLPVSAAKLALLNRNYVYPGGEHDLRELFVVVDVSRRVEGMIAEIEPRIEWMLEVIAGSEAPEIEINLHCDKPYRCRFYIHCHRDMSRDDILCLPRIGKEKIETLRAQGVRMIGDIPEGFRLSPTQERVRRAVATGEPYLGEGLAEELDRLRFPIHFLDFETVATGLPKYIGTRPYQVVPFQWSDHVLFDDGRLEHLEFLHRTADDPREPFCTSLATAIEGAGSIVVYSSYEEKQLKGLEEWRSDLAESILHQFQETQFDLYELIRKFVYLPEFGGSLSLKKVVPAVVPQLDYKDLEIQEGGTATVRFARMIHPDTEAEETSRIASDLLAYCERDTLTMVRMVEALRELAGAKADRSIGPWRS